MATELELSPVTYDQIPVFGKLGKILVDAAPPGSGRQAQISPISQSSSLATAGAVANPSPLGDTGGGGQPPQQPNFGTITLTVCRNGSPDTITVLTPRSSQQPGGGQQ